MQPFHSPKSLCSTTSLFAYHIRSMLYDYPSFPICIASWSHLQTVDKTAEPPTYWQQLYRLHDFDVYRQCCLALKMSTQYLHDYFLTLLGKQQQVIQKYPRGHILVWLVYVLRLIRYDVILERKRKSQLRVMTHFLYQLSGVRIIEPQNCLGGKGP